jgi:hypothetical protein
MSAVGSKPKVSTRKSIAAWGSGYGTLGQIVGGASDELGATALVM